MSSDDNHRWVHMTRKHATFIYVPLSPPLRLLLTFQPTLSHVIVAEGEGKSMQPAQFRQADFLLIEINSFTRPAVSLGEERGLLPEQQLIVGKGKVCIEANCGLPGRSFSRFLQHEATRSFSTPTWMGC